MIRVCHECGASLERCPLNLEPDDEPDRRYCLWCFWDKYGEGLGLKGRGTLLAMIAARMGDFELAGRVGHAVALEVLRAECCEKRKKPVGKTTS